MDLFRRIVAVGCLAGLLAGLSVTAVHLLWVVPLIVEAERYESGAAAIAHSHGPDNAASTIAIDHIHAGADTHEGSPLVRALWTAMANLLLGVGAGLVFAAAFAMRDGSPTWRTGLMWGGGACIALTLAPALGLPPELPGTAAAEIGERQAWWLFTVVSTAAALLIAANTRSLPLRATACAMLVMPHVIGAPHPDTTAALAPDTAQRQFTLAALVASALYWLVLGVVAASLAGRFHLPRVPLGPRRPANTASHPQV